MSKTIKNQNSKAALRKPKRAFLLVMVLLVVTGVSLGSLTMLETMVIAKDSTMLANQQTQARYVADSGIEFIRYFLASSKNQQVEAGGSENNPQVFQAVNVIPDTDPQRIANFTVLAPSLDEMGQISGVRYGLQNESARLNLNALVVIDEQYGNAAAAMSDLAGLAGGADLSSLGISSETVEQATSTEGLDNVGRSLLMGLPAMTEDVADAILDWLDEDDDPREFGCEVEYYSQLPTPYQPANGPLQSVEQLLLVRGVTPQLLFGLDQNRNGILDQGEMLNTNGTANPMGTMPMQGITASAQSSSSSAGGSDTEEQEIQQPDPLGWAAYLTLHSAEKNVDRDGNPRVYLNQDDLEVLEEELVASLGNETWATFIVAYRKAGKTGSNGASPVAGLAGASSGSGSSSGTGGSASGGSSAGSGTSSGGSSGSGGGDTGGVNSSPPIPWNSAYFDSVSGEATVTLSQVLDLVDATIEVQLNGEPVTYTSPFTSDPAAMAIYMPALMDKVTTVEATSIPGRISINDCPSAILRGIPTITSEIADAILEARAEDSDSENRKFESWLVVEGHITIDQMRSLAPLITGGGSVYRAQVVGYFEQSAAFCRVEAIVDAAGDVPTVRLYRRMDHLGRGFSLPILGQRSGVGGLGIMPMPQ